MKTVKVIYSVNSNVISDETVETQQVINGRNVLFKLDTGAKVSVLPLRILKEIQSNSKV